MQTNKLRRTFKSDTIEENFVKYGYTVIRNFINKDELEELRQVYKENELLNPPKSFYVSHWIEGGSSKKNIDVGIKKVLVSHIQQYLDDYIPVFAAMSVKHPAPDSGLHLHQDWAHVDETKYRSLNVWVALSGNTAENGPLSLLKGSHRLFDDVRGVAIPDTFHHINSENLSKYTTDFYLNPGDAMAWDHRVIHGSPVNRSKNLRLGAIVNMRPAESEFLLYYIKPGSEIRDGETEIEVYAPERDFFISHDSVNHPTDVEKAKFVRKYPYRDLNIQEPELAKFLLDEFPGEFPQIKIKKPSFISRLIGN